MISQPFQIIPSPFSEGDASPWFLDPEEAPAPLEYEHFPSADSGVSALPLPVTGGSLAWLVEGVAGVNDLTAAYFLAGNLRSLFGLDHGRIPRTMTFAVGCKESEITQDAGNITAQLTVLLRNAAHTLSVTLLDLPVTSGPTRFEFVYRSPSPVAIPNWVLPETSLELVLQLHVVSDIGALNATADVWVIGLGGSVESEFTGELR